MRMGRRAEPTPPRGARAAVVVPKLVTFGTRDACPNAYGEGTRLGAEPAQPWLFPN